MWTLPPTDSVLHLLAFVALSAEGMTAALAAGRRSMDYVGVCLLACVTALGGGTLRDLFLGHYPLVWVANPIYLALPGGAALLTIPIARLVHRLHVAFIVLDAIGLVIFTMIGCNVAWQMDVSLPIVIVSGMVTGCAGGVLRDVLCNDVPLLFRSELYASVSVVTGLFYATAFGLELNAELWTILTFVLGLSIRLLAVRYKWEMPKFVFTGDEEK
ncbi:Uncharacterized membrane protein YeiH [Bradyrhizobium sp. Ghvi]|uniref:trimeric intracellular cation channel family protein n=1 Tax=Bradyrhizobium sp. Ghvi TaxID=1855319 RepID=UPI0008F42C65|nr:trimeric intracellular cation channel family protein [Bradyrhizobium sp. Ghvi]SFO73832.1 Uncharacterized membrane protein YeiH [Bradyrhizobium sp. Ghvi]